MNMKLVCSVIIFLVCFGSAVSPKQEAVIITDIGASAETIGRGGVEGFSDAAHGIYENPASLYRIKHQSISLFTTKIINEVNYFSSSFATMTPWGKVGFGAMQATVYDIEKTARGLNDEIIVVDRFDFRSEVYKLAYQYSVTDLLSIGAAYSYHRNQYFTVNGEGYSADVGVLYQWFPFEISVSAKNILPNSNLWYYEGVSEGIPRSLVVGAKYMSDRGVSLYPQLTYRQDHILVALGGDYYPSFLPFLSFNAGLRQYMNAVSTMKQKTTLGIGLHLFDVHFYFAHERADYIPVDSKSYFSVNTTF